MERRSDIASITATGVQLLCIFSVISLLFTASIAAGFPLLFKQVEPDLVVKGRIGLLWIGAALSVALPFSGLMGTFIGLEKNDIPAYLAVAAKLLVAVSVALVAAATEEITPSAIAFFVASIAGYLLQALTFRLLCREWPLNLYRLNIPLLSELARYCASLGIWSIAMLMITGVTTTIVGIFAFTELASFGIALNLVTFLVGLQQAVMSPLIQRFARSHAINDWDSSRQLLLRSSYVCTNLLITTTAILILLSHDLLRAWVGPDYAATAYRLLIPLVLGNAIRSTAIPYAMLMIASGQQHKILASPLLEGITSLIACIVGVLWSGALGASVGVVAGAAAALIANYFYNMPRTLPTTFSIAKVFQASLLVHMPFISIVAFIIIAAETAAVGTGGRMVLCMLIAISALTFFKIQRRKNPDNAWNIAKT